MGFFDTDDENVQLENADLDCEPQNDFVSPPEVVMIDDKLDPGEKVHFMFTGGSGLLIDGEKKSDTGKSRTTITDRRVLLKVESGALLAGHEYHSFNYKNISSVTKKEGMIKQRLDIETSSKTYGVYLSQATMSDDVGDRAVEFIREKQREAKNREKSDENEDDPTEKIRKLQSLKEEGAITEEEFEKKKRDLLDQI